MISKRQGNHRSVSGAGGSCFYRCIAYQMCERANKPYDDASQVLQLRNKVCNYLHTHRNERLSDDPGLRWKDIGRYTPGYAEAPVPQAMPYVVGCPIHIHIGPKQFQYGRGLPGPPLHVRLAGQHYSIEYPMRM